MDEMYELLIKKHLKVITKYVATAGALIEANTLSAANAMLSNASDHIREAQQMLADANRQVKMDLKVKTKKV